MIFHPSVDIFCKVVDNYGDIGVCWRLARQLGIERGLAVRLFVDDPDCFRAVVPHPVAGVRVLPWPIDAGMYHEAADIVIEAFACDLPSYVVTAISRRPSVWIDLEYLSAEDWVGEWHAIPSRHPVTGGLKTVFFPGFDTRTGGLIRENDLMSRRNSFISDENLQNNWRKSYFLPEKDEKTLDISLFHYKTAPLERLFDVMAQSCCPDGRSVRLFQPVRDFKATEPIVPRPGCPLTVHPMPFVSQYDYDYLLWTCDVNFVRGEDSFVRAQWAGKPFVWNIYVQEENAHIVKLDAFLEKIRPFYDTNSFERLAILHDLWNEGGRNTWELWRDGLQFCDGLQSGARAWTDHLLTQTDLATQLLAFAEPQLTEKNKG